MIIIDNSVREAIKLNLNFLQLLKEGLQLYPTERHFVLLGVLVTHCTRHACISIHLSFSRLIVSHGFESQFKSRSTHVTFEHSHLTSQAVI